jgi:7-carboxy-7-deazaguanine synthase
MEHFATIQGEGRFSGTASYFIRLGGCDVGCHWCDVKESWPSSGYELMTASQIANLVSNSKQKIVVITGGEPLMHNLDELTQKLNKANVQCHIETSGAHPFSGKWDWITFSPKKFKAPLPGCAEIASELKVVIFNKSDFDFAQKHAAEVSEKCLLYLQPEWGKRETIMPELVAFVKANPRWRISLQTHKYLNIP